ncbi:MAG: tRNA guanosine(34) transglycosylase Tgt [Candidatus Helarchaeota archaeon]
MFKFEIIKEDHNTNARLGRIITNRGVIETPAFIPVATKGAVKMLHTKELKELGAQIIITNALHLFFNPGVDIIKDYGGIHKFMNWDGPIISDSGGFQVQKPRYFKKITDDYIAFRNPLNNEIYKWTPEEAINIQHKISADIIMAFDECTLYGKDYDYVKKSMLRTLNWAKRCKTFHDNKTSQILLPIVQGGTFKDLREYSAKKIVELGLGQDGIAIGGLSVGEPKEITYNMLDIVVSHLPKNRPRYLMGIGTPELIFESVSRGIDLYDSVYPTRTGRHRGAFNREEGLIKITKMCYVRDKNPIDSECNCFVCKNYSRGYINHLFKSDEPLGKRLVVLHNIHFIIELSKKIRESIRNGEFLEFKTNYLKRWLKKIR